MFLKKLFIVGIIAFAVCFATGRYFDEKYRKNWATLFFNAADTLIDKSRNYDIIFLGDSRIHFGINPYYVDSITRLSAFNFGIGGSDAEMVSLAGAMYLQNHPAPRFIVIGAGNSLLQAPESIKSQAHYLFYLDNKIVLQRLKKYHKGLTLAKWLPFLKYSYFDAYNKQSIFKKPVIYPEFDHNIYKGFINIQQYKNEPNKIRFAEEIEIKPIDTSSLNMIKHLIANYKKAGSIVIIVSPPVKPGIAADILKHFETTDAAFKRMAIEQNVFYLPSSDSAYTGDYFTDARHLNEPGTRIFSRRIGLFINEIQKKERP